MKMKSSDENSSFRFKNRKDALKFRKFIINEVIPDIKNKKTNILRERIHYYISLIRAYHGEDIDLNDMRDDDGDYAFFTDFIKEIPISQYYYSS